MRCTINIRKDAGKSMTLFGAGADGWASAKLTFLLESGGAYEVRALFAIDRRTGKLKVHMDTQDFLRAPDCLSMQRFNWKDLGSTISAKVFQERDNFSGGELNMLFNVGNFRLSDDCSECEGRRDAQSGIGQRRVLALV